MNESIGVLGNARHGVRAISDPDTTRVPLSDGTPLAVTRVLQIVIEANFDSEDELSVAHPGYGIDVHVDPIGRGGNLVRIDPRTP